jgi:hypothetical protein
MKGAKLLAKFWRGSKDDFKFKNFGDPRTRKPPMRWDKKDEKATGNDIDVVSLGDDGQAEVDIELQMEDVGSDI